jgi:hypothetical protein
MVLMLPYVRSDLRVHNSAERHKPEREPYNDELSNPTVHRPLSKSRCLHRLLFLNSCNDIVDLLLGQKAAFDVFLHAPLLVDEDAYR